MFKFQWSRMQKSIVITFRYKGLIFKWHCYYRFKIRYGELSINWYVDVTNIAVRYNRPWPPLAPKMFDLYITLQLQMAKYCSVSWLGKRLSSCLFFVIFSLCVILHRNTTFKNLIRSLMPFDSAYLESDKLGGGLNQEVDLRNCILLICIL